jgi:uncharacterized membrane protein
MEHIFPRVDRRKSRQQLRLTYGLAGGALLALGIKRGSFFGGILSLAGANLLVKGVTGHDLLETFGVTSFTQRGQNAQVPHQLGVQIQRTITIGLPPEDIYGFIRNFENLPRFMRHVQSVEMQGDKNAHWVIAGPAGRKMEWDSEIINDIPNELIAWQSVNCPDMENAGSIRFEKAPQDRGTILRLSLRYMPPAGSIGAAIAKLFGKDPEAEIAADLRRLKQLLETGEVSTTKGQPVGGFQKRRVYERAQERNRDLPESSSEAIPSETELSPEKAKSASASGSSSF